MFKNLLPYAIGKTFYNYNEPQQKPKVLVLGNGYSGRTFANYLDKNKYNLTVVDKNTYTLKTHKMSSIKLPIEYHNSYYYQGIIKKIDLHNDLVILDNKYINYDYLIFALGSEVNTYNIKGVDKYCHFYKSFDDWQKLEKIKDNHENVSIIGGGAVGIELAYKLNNSGNTITIVEAYDILPNYSKKTRDIITKDLEHKGIKLINQKVTEVCENTNRPRRDIHYDIIIKFTNGQNISSGLCIWTAGIKKHSLYPSNGPYVYAIGDNSVYTPMTAQKAVQEAKYMAKYFNSNFDEKYSPNKFIYKQLGKTIHTDDSIIIEFTDNITIKLPKYFSYFVDLFIDFML